MEGVWCHSPGLQPCRHCNCCSLLGGLVPERFTLSIISSWQGVKDPAKLRVACGAKNMSLTSPSYLDHAEVRLQVSEIVRHPGYRDPAIVVNRAGVKLHRLEVDVS